MSRAPSRARLLVLGQGRGARDTSHLGRSRESQVVRAVFHGKHLREAYRR